MKYFSRYFFACISFCMLFLGVNSYSIKQAHAAVACSEGAAAQNGIKVIPSHGQVFYIDSGVTPRLDAGYIGYRVVNQTGSTQSDLWTELSSFTGGVLSLLNPNDTDAQVSSLANGATGTTFYMLKATGATVTAQKHVVKVYEGRPDLQGSTVLYECEYTFNKVQETIKAAANKLIDNGLDTGDPIEVSVTNLDIGQLLTISVEGETGQIGAGSVPDLDIVWLTPAAVSSWPSTKLRLKSVSVTFDANKNWASSGDQVSFNDQLLIKDVDGTNVDSSAYRVYYTFLVTGSLPSDIQIVPIAQISSGTQVKHTDTSGAGAIQNIVFTQSFSNINLTKTITATSSLNVVNCAGACAVPGAQSGMTYVEVPYRLLASTNSVSTQALDEFIDIPQNGVIFKPGSATITDIGRTTSTIPDPVYLTSEALSNPRPLHFIGPFNISSTSSARLDYVMYVPTGTYANDAYAKIGDTTIGASASQRSTVDVTSNGTNAITFTTSTELLPIDISTDPATNVTTTSAVINGTIDANGATTTAVFQFSTDPGLAGFTMVTATTPTGGVLNGLTDATSTSVTLTGLMPNTTYYYRVVAGSSVGSILSFTTPAVLAAPTVTTLAATNVAPTTSTINGTINPNLTNITGIQFIWGTSTTLTSGNTTTTIDDGSGAELTISGASVQAFSSNLTGLTAGTTYYFKIRACTSALVGVYPNVECSSYVDGSVLSFVTPSKPSVTTSPASGVTSSSATLNGSITSTGGSNATVRGFEYGTTTAYGSTTTVLGDFGVISFNDAIIGLTPSTLYHYRAYATNIAGISYGADVTFTTSLLTRTLTIDPNSYRSTYLLRDTRPTLVAIPSAGTGTITFTSLTPSVCTVDAASGVATFVSTGPCRIYADITANGGYNAATSATITFTINSPGGEGGGGSSSLQTLITSSPNQTQSSDSTVTSPSLERQNDPLNNAPFCNVCNRLSYDVYIINPDGTVRRTGTPYVKVSNLGNKVTRYAFEDATINKNDPRFDYDDVVVDIDTTDCNNLRVSFKPSSASWKHKVMLKVLIDGKAQNEITLAENSRLVSGQTVNVDATQSINLAEACKKPEPKACDLCSRISYDVYIINPDGTERHTGTPWVKTRLLSQNLTRYSFEDKTLDRNDFRFNHQDVIVDMDTSDCENLKITFGTTTAAWRHKIRLAVSIDGKQVSDTLIVENSRLAALQTVRLNALQGIDVTAACVKTPSIASACKLSASITQTMSLRTSGPQVQRVQDLLSCLGYFPTDTDKSGFYGTVTENAVKAFQRGNGLPDLGNIGPLTLRLLNTYR